MKNEIHVIDNATKHHFNSGVYAREMHIPKGFEAETHSHNFAHMSILAEGKVFVTANGVGTEYTAPTVISMGAGIHHGIYAVEDSVWFCIHPTDEVTPEAVDAITIQEASHDYFKEGGEWEKKYACMCDTK